MVIEEKSIRNNVLGVPDRAALNAPVVDGHLEIKRTRACLGVGHYSSQIKRHGAVFEKAAMRLERSTNRSRSDATLL